ncbi:MAG TPA: transposase [Kofleriaceae bacterium]|nr:transposase [Kofleriaceae bacterium]
MPRSRKRHVQQELFRPRGGKRAGAGRKPKGVRAGSPHKTRPELSGREPVHVVIRVADDVRGLRKRSMYRALRQATLAAARREQRRKSDGGAFRIVHVSMQQTHVHMLVEADHKEALSRGMQSFQISAAKHVNAALVDKQGRRRRGAVFPDRFHQEVIRTPRQARHTLAYVLNNWRKHRADTWGLASTWNVDPFSTGALFAGWRERLGQPLMWTMPATYQPMFVYLPQTWLLSVGWQKAGDISFHEVPGPRETRSRGAPQER